MAPSLPGRLTNHTENTEGSSAEPAQAGTPESAGRLEAPLLLLRTERAPPSIGLAWQTVLGWPCATTRPSSPSLTADPAAN